MIYFMNYRYFVLLGVLTLSEAFTQTPPTSENKDADFRKKLSEAYTELQNSNFSKSLSLIDEAEKIKPEEPAILSFRGNVFTKQKEYSKANEIYLKLLEKIPQDSGVIYNMGEVAFLQKNYVLAREKFNQSLELSKSTAKDQATKLPFGEATIDFLNYKIFFTYLLEDNLTEAQSIQKQFDAYSVSPAYYFANACIEFHKKNPLEGMKWIASASSIYNPMLLSIFADSLLEKGWVKPGKNPGEITIDQIKN